MLARALIVLLVVLNLGVALWWLTRPAPDAGPAPAARADGPPLFLLSEVPGRQWPSSSAAVVQEASDDGEGEPRAALTAATGDGIRCLSLGPFADAPAAARARASLAGSGLRQASVREQSIADRGWNVAMPPLADRAAAIAMATRLRAAGFEDLFVLSDGASANGIALGRYGSESTARQRVATLRAAGFEAVAEPVGDGGVRHWLDIAADADFDAAAAQRRSGAPGFQPMDCGSLG